MPNSKRQLSLYGFDDDEPVGGDSDSSEENHAEERAPTASLNVSDAAPSPALVRSDASSKTLDLQGRTVYVIDSHSLIFQVFHAIREMNSPSGRPVAAIYGFTRDLFYLLEEKKPDFLICAFDLPGPTFRHTMYEPYKADRSSMPEELAEQMPAIRTMLEALGIPSLDCPTYEADDVLATVARLCDEAGANCFLVTGDKDCRQLITDRVKIYNVRKDTLFDREALQAEWGIRPDQVVDFQAMVGDSVDNIPGIPLIGPKIARQLLEQYDTLDEVLDHASEVTGAKRRQNLMEGRDIAEQSRVLAKLVEEVPITVDWQAARPGRIDVPRTLELFDEYGFRSLGDRLKALAGVEVTPEPWDADYLGITTEQQLADLVESMRGQKEISLDVETTSVSPRWAQLVGYSFCFEEGRAYYVPVRTPEGDASLDPQKTLDALRPILEDPKIGKIGQNIKYDMIVLRSAGANVRGVVFDTMVASYLLDAGQRAHNLDELSRRYLNHETVKIDALIGRGKQQILMSDVPLDKITHYAAEDADIPLRLRSLLQARLDESELNELYHDLELPLIDVLVEMEFNGIRVNVERLAELSGQYQKRLDVLEEEIYALAGRTFNIASPKQLSKVLFEDLGLPVLKKTKSGASTDASVLEQLAHDHPLPAKIVEYRQFAKLKNTYVDALPALVHPETGRVHASFNQVVAATGRLSSSDPNLQNIPVRTDRGREIRSAFLPGEPDWKLLAADYSQVELRVLAHCSGDETLSAAFQRDEDVHAMVASQVYEVPIDQVTSDMRRGAKAVNFGVIYGQSAFGLAKALDIDQDKAATFIDAYFERYPRVDTFLSEVIEQCRHDGYVTTLFGRRRKIDGIRQDAPSRQRNLAERTAINTVIQGSAADLIKRAMVGVYHRLKAEAMTSRLLLQIHDELILEVPPDEIDRATQLVREEMENAAELSVPLKVDISLGSNWAEV